jgi:hypothetical protein
MTRTYRIERAKLIDRNKHTPHVGPPPLRLVAERDEFNIVPASWNDFPDVDVDGGLTCKAVSFITSTKDVGDGWLEIQVAEHVMPKAGWDLLVLQARGGQGESSRETI